MMPAKVLNAARNERALNECEEMRRVTLASHWTIETLRSLVDDDGNDIVCPRCGTNVRHHIGMGGPALLRRFGWRLINGRWHHRCRGKESINGGA